MYTRDKRDGRGTRGAIEEARSVLDNNRLCIDTLQNYVKNHRLSKTVDGCTIHGNDGPVWWSDIRKHPKVQAKMVSM